MTDTVRHCVILHVLVLFGAVVALMCNVYRLVDCSYTILANVLNVVTGKYVKYI